jgi:hypothetical protein
MLCLTNLGLHIFLKKRPIDYLYNFLNENKINEIHEFFQFYGTVEASTMCLGDFFYMSVHIYTDVFFSKYVYKCVSECMYIHINIFYIYVRNFIHMNIYTYAHIYIWIYI